MELVVGGGQLVTAWSSLPRRIPPILPPGIIRNKALRNWWIKDITNRVKWAASLGDIPRDLGVGDEPEARVLSAEPRVEARMFSFGKWGCTGSPLMARLGRGLCSPRTLCREVRGFRPWTRSRGRFVEREGGSDEGVGRVLLRGVRSSFFVSLRRFRSLPDRRKLKGRWF